MTAAQSKLNTLIPYIAGLGSLAIAYSGGVDSSLLLSVARDILDENVIAITIIHSSFTRDEARDAKRFCEEQGIRQIEAELDLFKVPGFSKNTPERCYICKKEIFSLIRSLAAAKGFKHAAEGSNKDDESDFRPGLRALEELNILSPLRYARLTKADIRELSESMGIKGALKPSSACLSTRIPYGEEITGEKLCRIAAAEEYLKELGFSPVRVRAHGDIARIEVQSSQFAALIDERAMVEKRLGELGFLYVTLDLNGFCSGSMNRALRREKYEKGSLS